MARRIVGYGAALLSAIFIGTGNIAAKIALEQGAPPLVFLGAAMALAAILASPFLPRFERPRGRDRWLLAGGIVAGNVAAPVLVVLGLASVSGVTSALLVDLELAFTAGLAFVFLRERLPWREAAAFATIGAGGIVVSVGNGLAQTGTSTPVGILLVSLGVLAFSVDNVVSTRLAERYDLRGLVAFRFLVGGLALAALALLVDRTLLPPRVAWLPLAYQAVFTIALNVALFYVALRALGATRSIVVSASAGLWGALAGVALLHERLAWPHYAGGALMLAGALALAWSIRARGASGGSPPRDAPRPPASRAPRRDASRQARSPGASRPGSARRPAR